MYGNYPMQQQSPQSQLLNGLQTNGIPAAYPPYPYHHPHVPQVPQFSPFARNMANGSLGFANLQHVPFAQNLYQPTAPTHLFQHAPLFHQYSGTAPNMLQPHFLTQQHWNLFNSHHLNNFSYTNTASPNSQQLYGTTRCARPQIDMIQEVTSNQDVVAAQTKATNTYPQYATAIPIASTSQVSSESTIDAPTKNLGPGPPRLLEKMAETAKEDDDEIQIIEHISTSMIKKNSTAVDDDVIEISRPTTPTVKDPSKKQPTPQATVTKSGHDGEGIPNDPNSIQEKDCPDNANQMFDMLTDLMERGLVEECSEEVVEVDVEENKDEVDKEDGMREEVVPEAGKRESEEGSVKFEPKRKNRKPKESVGERKKRRLAVEENLSTSDSTAEIRQTRSCDNKKAKLEQLCKEELNLMLQDFSSVYDDEEFEV